MAKGVTAQASQKIELTRKDKKPITVDRKADEQGTAKDVELQPGDKVFVLRK